MTSAGATAGRPATPWRGAPPEALFVVSGFSQYTGAAIAVRLFDDVSPQVVTLLRSAVAAVVLLLLTARSQRRWNAADLGRAALFGVITAAMNLAFYLAIDRLPMGKSVVIEFIGPIAVAAALTRTRRNGLALGLAVIGVIVLSGVELDSEPLGLTFILVASILWAGYIVLARHIVSLDRGLGGLAVSFTFGTLALTPVGLAEIGSVSGSTLGLAAMVGLLSSALPYSIDQIVLRRIPTRRFAVLLALLPVTALVVGAVGLGQHPSAIDLGGALLVVCGVLVQERDVVDPVVLSEPA